MTIRIPANCSTRNNLTSLRGLMAILIFLHHAIPVAGYADFYDLGNPVVLFFFVLSGYVLTLTYQDRINTLDFSFRQFMVKRCAKVYPIQWLTVAMTVCLTPSIRWTVVLSHLTLTHSFIPKWQYYDNLNGASWYLSSLLLSYLLFVPLLRFMLSHLKLSNVLFVLATVSWMSLLILLPENIGRAWIGYYNPFARVLDFALGMLLALQADRLKKSFAGISCTCATLLEITAVSCFVWRIVKTFWFPGWYIPVAYGYPVTCLLIGLFSTECKGWVSWLLNRRWLIWLGEISLCIYMLQFVFVLWLEQTAMPASWALAASFAVLVVLSWITQKTFIPWSTRWFTHAAEKLLFRHHTVS